MRLEASLDLLYGLLLVRPGIMRVYPTCLGILHLVLHEQRPGDV